MSKTTTKATTKKPTAKTTAVKVTKKPAAKTTAVKVTKKPAAKTTAVKVTKKPAAKAKTVAKSMKKPAVVSTQVAKAVNKKVTSKKAKVPTSKMSSSVTKLASTKVKSENDSMDKTSCHVDCKTHYGCKFLNYLGFLRLSPRMNRQKFLVLHIFWAVIFTLLLSSLVGFNFDSDMSTQANNLVASNDYTLYQTAVLCVAFPLLFINNIFMAIRRLNDTNLRGWWILVSLIPFVGLLWYIALYFIPGTKGKNRFGNDPLKS